MKIDLVHGDLRDANIICRRHSTMMPVEFDWGCQVREAYHPTLELNHELLEGGGVSWLENYKEDDRPVKDDSA